MNSNKLGIQSLSFVVVATYPMKKVEATARLKAKLNRLIPSALIDNDLLPQLAAEILAGPDDRIPDDGGDSILCACVSYSKASGWTVEFDRITI